MFRRITCVAVIGLLVVGAVQASPKGAVLDLDGNPTGATIERIPEGPMIKLFSVQSENNMSTGVDAEAVVYQTVIPDRGEFGVFHNMDQTTGLIFPGYMFGDNMTLGAGFAPGDAVSAYYARLYRSSLDPRTGGLADVHIGLWDGDPFNGIDTIGDGYAVMEIMGTGADFIDIPTATRVNAYAVLPKGTTIPHQRVWMVLSGTTGTLNAAPCRMAWIISDYKPRVGSDAPDDLFMYQEDRDGSENGNGTCCVGGEACIHTGNPCPEEIAADGGATDRHWCADGDAERAVYSWFGGPCTGDPTTDSCANMVATIWAPAQCTITLQPVDSTVEGAPNVVSITDNHMLIEENGSDVLLEFKMSDFDPDDVGVQLKAYQANLDSAGYNSGDSGYLSPRLEPCATDAECIALFGGACGGFTLTPGAPCTIDDDCPDVVPDVMVGVCEGMTCGYPIGVGGNCDPGYILSKRSDYAFVATGNLPVVDQSTLDFRYASAISTTGVPQNDPVPWVRDQYLGSLRLDVSADAKGTFTVEMMPNSVLVDQNSYFIPLVGLIPGEIEIQTGQCCIDLAGAGGCVEGVTRAQCDFIGSPDGKDLGPVNFDPNKTCAEDCIECLNDGMCDDSNDCTIDTCCVDPAGCDGTPIYFCNPPAAVDCTDGLVCTTDMCDTVGGCWWDPIDPDDGLGCTDDACVEPIGVVNTPKELDDGQPCTYDYCTEPDGTVYHDDITMYPCVDVTDCPVNADGTPIAQGCAAGFCFCDPCPRDPLYFEVSETCADEGTKVTVNVMKPQTGGSVTGAQGTVYFDPTCVEYNGMTLVEPFVFDLPGHGTMVDGGVFFAVGVNPFGGMGIGDPSPFVSLSFTKIGDCNCCGFDLCDPGTGMCGMNPYDLIVQADGNVCPVQVIGSDDVCDVSGLTLTVPDSVITNADCDFPTAIVTWDEAPSCMSDCGECDLRCTAEHDGGQNIDHLIMGGGEFPQGISTFTCYATDSWVCPGTVEPGVWTVEVTDQQTLDVTVQLSPIMKGDVTRCIKFQLYENCVADPIIEEVAMFFGGAYDFLGHFTDTIKIDKGQFACITARDQHHSLRSCDFPTCEGGVYTAMFKGDPFFGGNWLVQGNLDGWKKTDLASVDVIDILDFGQFVANYNTEASLTVDCTWEGAHADINGDTIVDALDFSFVTANFLASSKDCCCGAVASDTTPLLSISVRDLRANGLEELIQADLNRDGVLDTDDVSAFMAGERPAVKTRVRNGAGLRR